MKTNLWPWLLEVCSKKIFSCNFLDEFDDLSSVPSRLQDKIPADAKANLEKLLLDDEKVIHIEAPLFWQSMYY